MLYSCSVSCAGLAWLASHRRLLIPLACGGIFRRESLSAGCPRNEWIGAEHHGQQRQTQREKDQAETNQGGKEKEEEREEGELASITPTVERVSACQRRRGG